MNPERQRLVRATFDAASCLPPAEQADFVRSRAGEDPEVAESVLRLLRASQSGGSFMAKPLVPREPKNTFAGTRLGAYKIVRELGAGGMGVVYLAVRADETFRRDAAIKVIRPEFQSPAMIERFVRERQLLAELDHPNIARIIDGGTTPANLPYFVMDYVEGRPIDVFANGREADLNQRLNLFRQVCEAVGYLHDNRVLHRDLKPANILVTSSGSVKLLDFGIAKLLDSPTDAQVKTAPLLTPGYASPEQVSGKPTGVASDIYSLGAVLYELLTGRRPHETSERSVAAAVHAITRDTIRKPSTTVQTNALLKSRQSHAELSRRLQGDLDSILLKALRQEPELRYSSVAAFSADIERYQAQQPVAAREGARLYRVSRFTRRNRLPLATAALLLVSFSWAGHEQWRVHQLLVQLNSIQPAEQALTQEIQAPSAKPGTPRNKDPQQDARLEESLKQITHSYDTTFPELVRSPLAPQEQSEQLLTRDLTWLQHIQPLVDQQPQLSTDLSRAFLSMAKAQWSDTVPSLNDAGGSLETCKLALAVLEKIPSTSAQTDDILKLEQALSRQMTALSHKPA